MTKIIEGYILSLTEIIGEGSFSTVYKATHKEKAGIFAVKVIPIEKFQQNPQLEIYTNNEVEALQTIGANEYIIRFYELIKSKKNWYLVYELCDGGTLMNFMKREEKIEENKALFIFRQLLEAFKVLNKYSIMHRDLKPENIFFTSDKYNLEENFDPSTSSSSSPISDDSFFKKKIKLGDFGFCKGLKPDENLTKTMLGSPIYMAPEVLKGESYTTKADIWSLGVILYEMIYGYCPFQSSNIYNLINTIVSQNVALPEDVPVSEKTQNLIRKMLAKDYFRRIGWVELFGIKIDENGKYCDEPEKSEKEINQNSSQSCKEFFSLGGSLSIQPNISSFGNSVRSYLTKDDEEKKEKSESNFTKILNLDTKINNDKNVLETRGNSQPKDQKKFYSQNYLSILSTPIPSKQNELIKEDEKPSNHQVSTRESESTNISSSVPLSFSPTKHNNSLQAHRSSIPITPPILLREERITSMDNIEPSGKEPISSFSGLDEIKRSKNTESTPFNKYRENIGLGSNLSSKLISDRNIKDNRHSSTISTKTIPSINEMDVKRSNLLKVHESITKTVSKAMVMLSEKFSLYKISLNTSDFQIVQEFLQDCYVVLKIMQEKLRTITESIKITETSLLDIKSFVNHEDILVERFIIEIRNELMRFGADLPSYPKVWNDGIQSREMIRNKYMVQVLDDSL